MVPIKSRSDIPFYQQIYDHLKGEIRTGAIRAGGRLPSTRLLAEHLKVSRSTTQMAYDQLLSEGYIEAVPCKGYYASNIETLLEVHLEPDRTTTKVKAGPDSSFLFDFSPRGIDLNHFPFSAWRKISKNILVDDNKELFLAGDPQGERTLREAVASYLHSARGARTSPERIIIGAGNEYLLMLLQQILGPDKTIAMENPTYRQASLVFSSSGYLVRPVEMDRYGMDVKLLEASQAQIAYVMPSHQFPTGIVMPVKRRQELLSWAYERAERYLIEDDYDSEFRYRGKPIPALQGLDQRGKVIYIGTFSKSIAPAIRVGYLVLPEELMDKYREQAGFYASTVSRIDQSVLYGFMADGFYERHLNRMRAIYRGKHDVLLSALKPLESQFEIRGENAGLHLLLTDKKGRSERKLIDLAGKKGVKVYGYSSYFIGGRMKQEYSTVVLGFANLAEEEIVGGIGLLIQAWENE